MFDLTRQEKIILLFFTFSFVLGLGVNVYRKAKSSVKLDVQPYELAATRKEINKFIVEQNLININSLNKDELKRLPGVGEKLAQRIVEYHKMHGPFKNKEELLKVDGIGQKKFGKLKELLVVE
jgi:competence protein ComEA